MGRVALLAGFFLLLPACGGSSPPGPSTNATSHVTSPPQGPLSSSDAAVARSTTGGCGPTPAFVGSRPGWLPDHTDPTPYVIASPPTAAAILVNPLRAGHPSNPSNKVAWVTRTPKRGTPLLIDAHPVGASQPVVRFEEPASSVMDAGYIYTSYIDLPTPGCWQLSVRWGSPRQSTIVDVLVSSSSG